MSSSLNDILKRSTQWEVALLLLAASIGLTSCDFLGGDEEDEQIVPAITSIEKTGAVELSAGINVNYSSLEVVTFSEIADVQSDGTFTVDAPSAENYQVLFLSDRTSRRPVLLAVYRPGETEAKVDIESTAEALTLLNPYLIALSSSDKHTYLNKVKEQQNFQRLLDELQTAYLRDPSTALSFEENPEVFNLLVNVIRTSLQELGMSGKKTAESGSRTPVIEDVFGDSRIQIVNPRHVYYGAGVSQLDGQKDDVFTVERTVSLVSLEWGLPPIGRTEPAVTDYDLGDGEYLIRLEKGFDFAKIAQLNDPAGRATLFNTGTAFLYLLELALGTFPTPDFVQLPNHMVVSDEIALKMTNSLREKNVESFLVDLLELLVHNKEGIAFWIYQETSSNAAHHTIDTVAGLLKRITFVLELLGYVNEQGPFIWDAVRAPASISYTVSQVDGSLSRKVSDEPPSISIEVSPKAGVVGTKFMFDATATSDNIDSNSDLESRWDFNSDGVWDFGWSSSLTAEKVYDTNGSYLITVEIRDTSGLRSSETLRINVGGGTNTAQHVKLFIDEYPWDNSSMIVVLESLGFTPGQGADQYEVIPSSRMSEIDLVPGQDLVIISNDQPQMFYNNYAMNQVRFNQFVYSGGSMLWEACDLGWNNGSIEAAGIILPGNVQTEQNITHNNYTVEGDFPITASLPTILDHNYASHESFITTVDGAIVYTTDSGDKPTLMEYNFGDGWMIATGQPLEHQYDSVYGAEDMHVLLPRIISHFTGREAPVGKNIKSNVPGRTLDTSSSSTTAKK